MSDIDPWIADKPTIIPLIGNRARLIIPTGSYEYSSAW